MKTEKKDTPDPRIAVYDALVALVMRETNIGQGRGIVITRDHRDGEFIVGAPYETSCVWSERGMQIGDVILRAHEVTCG